MAALSGKLPLGIERCSGTVLLDIAPDHAIDCGIVRRRLGFLDLSFPSRSQVSLFGGFQSSVRLICRVHARGTFRGHNSRTGRSNVRFGWKAAIARYRRYPHFIEMDRATINLALSVFLALMGCDRPEASQVRLVNVQHAPSGCHLTLNGVQIPDNVLVAKGKMQRRKQAVASGEKDEPDSCVGATFMLQQAGIHVDEMPSLNLSS